MLFGHSSTHVLCVVCDVCLMMFLVECTRSIDQDGSSLLVNGGYPITPSETMSKAYLGKTNYVQYVYGVLCKEKKGRSSKIETLLYAGYRCM